MIRKALYYTATMTALLLLLVSLVFITLALTAGDLDNVVDALISKDGYGFISILSILLSAILFLVASLLKPRNNK